MPSRSLRLAIPTLLVLAASPVAAQSALAARAAADTAASTRSPGANSPWTGAQVAYRFGGGGDAADHLLVAGQVLQDIVVGKDLHLPVMGNIASLADGVSEADEPAEAIEAQADRLLLTAEGISAGVFPYYVARSTTFLEATVHGVAAWRMNALRAFGDATPVEEAERVYLHQAHLAVGMDIRLGERRPDVGQILLSAAVARRIFAADGYEAAFGERKSGFTNLELASVLPVEPTIGVLFEGILSRSNGNAFRAGVILAPRR